MYAHFRDTRARKDGRGWYGWVSIKLVSEAETDHETYVALWSDGK